MHTFRSALDLVGVSVPSHLAADAEVPVLAGPQAQGELMVVPAVAPSHPRWLPVPDEGLRLVDGAATGDAHWLHRGVGSPGVRWAAAEEDGLILGWLAVPPGESALLIHTGDHGVNGIGPGTYTLNRKREATAELGNGGA